MAGTSRVRSAAGGEAWERDAVFEARGLSCRGCARHAEEALRCVKGIRSARVSFTAELAQVVYDARATSEPDITAAMVRAGFRLQPASGLPAPRALRQDRAALVVAMILLTGLLALSTVRGSGAALGWLGIGRAAGGALILALGAAPLARQAAALGRRGQLALDAPVLAAALLAFLTGLLELWVTTPGASPPATLAALGLRREAWQAAQPLGFELCGLLVALAICARCAYIAARERAAAGLALAAPAGATGDDARSLAGVRQALARVDRPEALRLDPRIKGAPAAASEGFLDVAARSLCVAAPALAAFALVVHAALGGGPLSPGALLAPIAVLAGCSPAAFWLAAPAARALAIARARAGGIVVKHPRALESVARVDTVCLDDPLRPGVEEVARALGNRGLDARILSGERHAAARSAGERLGIRGFGALSAAGKALYVRHLQRAGARVLFVGSAEGAWSAQADASVILAHASPTAAIPAAIGLTGDRLERLPYLIDLSRALRARLRQGVAVSALYNAVVLPCAALGWCPPAAAAALALLEALLVLVNAGRLPRPPGPARAAPVDPATPPGRA